MIPDTIVHLALYAGGFALILYWCWCDARQQEEIDRKGEDNESQDI